jgi:hypothetical protein
MLLTIGSTIRIRKGCSSSCGDAFALRQEALQEEASPAWLK